LIESYSFGSIKINGKIYKTDVIVFPHSVSPGWWRQSGHLATEADLGKVFDFNPEVFVIGTGSSGLMKVDQDLKNTLKARNIIYIIKRTPQAVEEYNRLCRIKRTAGAFHITC
jgi:hypothetical protein